MYFLAFISVILLALVAAIFAVPAQVHFLFDTDNNRMDLNLYWLQPIVHVKLRTVNFSPQITLQLLDKQVYERTIKAKKTPKKQFRVDYLHAVELRDSIVKVWYGFESPFSTAMISGALQMIQSFFNAASLEEYPDFLPWHEYFVIEARTNFFMGVTLIHFVKLWFHNKKTAGRNRYGSVQFG